MRSFLFLAGLGFLMFVGGPLLAQSITISSITGGLSPTTQVGGATNVAIFGIQVDKAGGGTSNVSKIVVKLTQDPAGKFLNPRLVFSSDATFDAGDLSGTIFNGVLDSPGDALVFDQSPGNITSFGGNSGPTTRHYFVVVDIDPTVTNATAATHAIVKETDLTAGSTVNAATLTGSDYSFQEATTTIANLTTGVAASPLVAASTNQAVLGFSLTSTGAQTVSEIDIQLSSDPTNKWGSYSLVRSGDGSFSTTGDNTTIGSLTFTPSATQLVITGLSENISSTTKNYFLVATVNSGVTSATASLAASIDGTNIVFNGGTATGTATGTTYSFDDLRATVSQLTNGIAPSPLAAGATNKAVLGFSLSSNGSQIFSALDVLLSSNPSGKFASYTLVRSGDNDFSTGGDNTTIGSLTFTPSATKVTITGLNETITSSATNYFLVVTVSGGVSNATASIKPSFSNANITVSAGTVVAATVTGTDYSFSSSGSSDIILNGGTTASIDYKNFQTASGLTTGNAEKLATLQLRDGGGSNDGDSFGTTLTDLTLQIGNYANVQAIALFDAGVNIGEQAVTGPTVTFTGLTLNASDNGTNNFDVRATFKAIVTDKQAIQLTVNSATASASGSVFSSSNAGGATTGGATNIISVDADRVVFLSNPPTTQANTNFSLSVKAVDALGNLDLDKNGQITLSVSGGPGTLSAGVPESTNPNLVNGAFAWTKLRINLAGTYTITGAYSGLTSASGSVTIQSVGVNITKATAPSLCFDGDFQTLTPIIIQESDPSDFGAGSNQTFSLQLPSGFIFNTAVTTAPTVSGNEISGASALSYIGSNVVRFSYSVSGTSNGTFDQITISGLQVKYTGTAAASGNIIRIGGSALQTGNADTDNNSHGLLTAAVSATPVSFTVQELAGDPAVNPNETQFNVNAKPVKLIGSPAGGSFSGNGVAYSVANGYTFNPSVVGVGTYSVSYSYREATGQHCLITVNKQFFVYSSVIQNLDPQYCDNNTPSTGLTVPQSQIDSYFSLYYGFAAGTMTLYDFVYYQTSSFSYVPITPANDTFDPSFPDYAASMAIYGRVYVYYRAKNTIGTIYYGQYQTVIINKAPNVTFQLPASFCSDDTPYALVGSPAPANPTFDKFTGTAVTPSWNFNPSSVAGASSSAQNVNITYTYRDPLTTCLNSITKSTTVYPRPSGVPGSDITSGGVSQNICPGQPVSDFTATTAGSYNYLWYADNSLTDLRQTGNTFSPSVNTNNTTSSPISYNFYVTRSSNGCESRQAPLTLTVTVNPQPASPSSFSRQYCTGQTVNNSDLAIGGSNVRWYHSGNPSPIVVSNANNPTATELGISTAANNVYFYDVTQTVLNCESKPASVSIVVNPLPAPSINSSSDLAKICKTGDIIKLNTNVSSGTWSGTASFALSDPVPADGITKYLNPSNLNPGNYTLRYDYTDASTNCSGYDQKTLTVLPTITPNLQYSVACNGQFVDLENNSVINPGSASSTIDSVSWNFDDGDILAIGKSVDPIPAGANAGNSKGSYFQPSHKFRGLGSFTVKYQMKTSDGCVVQAQKSVLVSPLPVSNFVWTNACEGSSSQFQASTSNLPDAAIGSYTWNFAQGNVLTYTNAGTGKNPTVDYTSTGRDIVQLVVTTIAQCKDTVSKPVYIVPSIPAITSLNSYSQDFNSSDGGWLAGGTNSSWQYGHPAAPVINRDSSLTGGGNAWATNLTGLSNPKEQSWVLSPCFDFTLATKPVISLDIWSDTPKRLDGAVLQYLENGVLEDDAQWKVVGDINSGINWYNDIGISSKPGNQVSGDAGWTGEAANGYKSWKHAVYKLDDLVGKSNIKFRIAFGSNQGSHEGFAFDNVFIGERSRSVLIENFTNASGQANVTAHNAYYNNFAESTGEVVKIQYHTSFPGDDLLNKANQEMNDARTAFYGITSSPDVRIDGQYSSGPIASWVSNLYDNRVLEPSPVKINITSVTKDGASVKIKVELENINSVPLSLTNAHLFVVITEKSITASPWLGQSGNSEFRYVARSILPTPAGLELNTILGPNATLSIPELVWDKANLVDPSQASIAVFVQDVSGPNRRTVYQASVYGSTTPSPDLVTGNEVAINSLINLFPNPVDEKLNIVLPSNSDQAFPVRLFDSFGREVYSAQFQKGNVSKTISTKDLTSGLYILELDMPSTVIRKKIIIAH